MGGTEFDSRRPGVVPPIRLSSVLLSTVPITKCNTEHAHFYYDLGRSGSLPPNKVPHHIPFSKFNVNA